MVIWTPWPAGVKTSFSSTDSLKSFFFFFFFKYEVACRYSPDYNDTFEEISCNTMYRQFGKKIAIQLFRAIERLFFLIFSAPFRNCHLRLEKTTELLITKNAPIWAAKKMKKSGVIKARLAILILKNILLVTSLALRC